MNAMFANCKSLSSLNLSNFDTPQVIIYRLCFLIVSIWAY